MTDHELRDAGRIVQRTIDGAEVGVVEKEFVVLSYDEESRSGEIVASDNTVDRYGDTIEAAGWKLDSYQKNPVMLIDHSYSVNDIVGQCAPRIEGNRLIARFQLDDPASNRQASIVANLIKNRSLRAVSVGFRALAYERIIDSEGAWTGGFNYTSQELLEISWVAVPANPNAVMAVDPEERAASSDDVNAEVLIAAKALALAGKE